MIKIIEDKEQYDGLLFQGVASALTGRNGVLRGFEITEYELSSRVFIDINPGSFVRNGVVFVVRDKVVGSEENSEHDLEVTNMTDDPALTGSSGRIGTGVPRLYVVETNTDENDSAKKPVFSLKYFPGPTDIVIGFRYIKLIAGDEDLDPFLGETDAGDPDDTGFIEYVG
ncbi:MAG: hypothetical protein WC341_16330 [Bacteroidales bacterium]